MTLCERDAAGVWQVVRNVPLPVAEFGGLQSVALGGREHSSIAFLGLNAVAWMPLNGDAWELTTLDGYETPIKDGYLRDVISGDLDNDGIQITFEAYSETQNIWESNRAGWE